MQQLLHRKHLIAPIIALCNWRTQTRTKAHAIKPNGLDGKHGIPASELKKVADLHRHQLAWMLPLHLQRAGMLKQATMFKLDDARGCACRWCVTWVGLEWQNHMRSSRCSCAQAVHRASILQRTRLDKVVVAWRAPLAVRRPAQHVAVVKIVVEQDGMQPRQLLAVLAYKRGPKLPYLRANIVMVAWH